MMGDIRITGSAVFRAPVGFKGFGKTVHPFWHQDLEPCTPSRFAGFLNRDPGNSKNFP